MITRYRISEVRLDLGETQDLLSGKIARQLRISQKNIINPEIIRESIDARRKPQIKKVYTVDFSSPLDLNLPPAKSRDYTPPKANLARDKKIVIAGFGPAGIFAALTLAEAGYKPLIIERGKDVDQRAQDVQRFWQEGILQNNSNVQFGEGGAGTFSDGKLTTGIHDPRIFKVLSEFYRHGAPRDILYKQKPHIGTDLLRNVIKGIRRKIIELGGEIRFSTKLVDFIVETPRISKIIVAGDTAREEIPVDKLILAIGHSARDTFRLCRDKQIAMEQKAFSVGARIEHPQQLINQAQYGDPSFAETLGAADYKLHCKTASGRGVYTFCMCPGGEVILASSGEGQVLSNGMSYHDRAGRFANSALLVDVRKTDFGSQDILAGVAFQEKWEEQAYQLSASYDLLQSDLTGFAKSDLSRALPHFAVENMLEAIPILDQKLHGFASREAILKGPETRSSSPVRFLRNARYQSNIKNLYPIGEGAGYAGGIMSAAVDGIKSAEAIMSEF